MPFVTQFINDSLASGHVPIDFKQALVTPLLKKQNLDINVLKNYRPVSNLSFLSKVLERVVLFQINDHLSKNNLNEKLQSAYKSGHSTETALLKVTSDILNFIDTGHVSVLALLDLSSAFDTIDHKILLERLNVTFGISGTALKWIESYITDRSQRVKIKSETSSSVSLKFGVPQGSVLGPVLFSLYIQPLTTVIDPFNFFYHLYADDSQLYNFALLNDLESLLQKLITCVAAVNDWMIANKLKMNNDKTEIMLAGTLSKLNQIDVKNISFDGVNVTLSSKVKNLGVILDEQFTMDQAVSQVRKSCYFEMRKIAHLRPLISEDSTKQLISSFVLSKLDYCNSMRSGNMEKLQLVQNQAARLIKKLPKRHSISPVLKELHWLPVEFRLQYKSAILVYQCLNDTLYPAYMKEMLTQYIPSRSLRSSQKNQLIKPSPKLKHFGERAFTFVGPDLWNSLPEDVKSAPSLQTFKTKLKTYLFNAAYPWMEDVKLF